MKNFVLGLLVILLGIMSQANAQSAKVATVNLSQKDKQNSLLFQSLKGKDRLEVFKQLQTLIRVKGSATDVVTTSNRIGAKTTTSDEIVALLGQPDATIQQTLLQYNLKAGTSEKLVIGLDKNKLVQFFTIKN